jgi:hypothetical protein
VAPTLNDAQSEDDEDIFDKFSDPPIVHSPLPVQKIRSDVSQSSPTDSHGSPLAAASILSHGDVAQPEAVQPVQQGAVVANAQDTSDIVSHNEASTNEARNPGMLHPQEEAVLLTSHDEMSGVQVQPSQAEDQDSIQHREHVLETQKSTFLMSEGNTAFLNITDTSTGVLNSVASVGEEDGDALA